MFLPDQDTSVMNRFSQAKFKNLCLQATLQEIFNSQTQNIIKLHAILTQNTNSYQAS